MANKNEVSENKIIFEYFNCSMDKIGRDGGNKAQTLEMLFQLCL